MSAREDFLGLLRKLPVYLEIFPRQAELPEVVKRSVFLGATCFVSVDDQEIINMDSKSDYLEVS